MLITVTVTRLSAGRVYQSIRFVGCYRSESLALGAVCRHARAARMPEPGCTECGAKIDGDTYETAADEFGNVNVYCVAEAVGLAVALYAK